MTNPSRPRSSSISIAHRVRRASSSLKGLLVTTITLIALLFFLMPLGYGIVTSLKHENQIAAVDSPLWPALKNTYTWQGEEYPLYNVTIEGEERKLALVVKRRQESYFIDPRNPPDKDLDLSDASDPETLENLIRWEGQWRQLEPTWQFAPQWQNYPNALRAIDFLLLLRNTGMYAVLSTIGAVFSAALVAYGFARFRFPHKNVLFMIVMATIILPPAVTMIPTYAFFFKIGWVGTWLPLIVPAYFSNGYNIFLLRQFFLTIPRELDEAAIIDGASPFRVFTSVILPNAKSALITVTLFHFFYCWNDFFGPMIYLAGKTDLYPITVGMTAFNNLYTGKQNYIQAVALVSLLVPLVLFAFAQRFFIQGVVITGIEK